MFRPFLKLGGRVVVDLGSGGRLAATPDKPWRLQQLLHSQQIDEGRQKGVRSTNGCATEGRNGPMVV
jgi:hypothetical protein